MPNDPEPITAPAPAPTGEREERTPKITCEFCGCHLTKSGEVFRMSDKAREFRDADERIAEMKRDFTAATDRAIKAETELKNLRDSLEIESGNKTARGKKVSLYS